MLFIAADGGAAGLARLFDDRPALALEFPFDPEELEARARELVAQSSSPASLRERARQLWVRAEVERQYASLELPALRQAVDPRNAHRPVLLLGEPGSRRGLLARYIHIFAEPVRDAFALISLADLAPGELEATVLARTAGRRATVHLARLERAPRAAAGGARALPRRERRARRRADSLDRIGARRAAAGAVAARAALAPGRAAAAAGARRILPPSSTPRSTPRSSAAAASSRSIPPRASRSRTVCGRATWPSSTARSTSS